MSPQQPLLVIDKSFAQGTKASRLTSLNEQYTFLVPSAFYYEVFDSPLGIRPTLAGLREFRRVHVQTMMAMEINSGKPCLESEAPPLSVNSAVFTENWTLDAEGDAVLRKHEEAVVNPLLAFWESVIDTGVPGFTASELASIRGSESRFLQACKSISTKERIVETAKWIDFPNAAVFDESWISYRVLQSMLLQGLVLWRRYKTKADARSRKHLEHDLHDHEYLVLGLHCGALATNETSLDLGKASLSWRFTMLAPSGRLLNSQSEF